MKYPAAALTPKKLNSNTKKTTPYWKKHASQHKIQTKGGFIFMIKLLLTSRNTLNLNSKNIQ
jgi:hypothetical protein